MNVQQLINELEKAGDKSAIVIVRCGEDTARCVFPNHVIDKGFAVELCPSRHNR